MKRCSIIKLTKKDINKVYGGIDSDKQNDSKIGVDLGATEDFLGGLKKDKIDIDNSKIKLMPIPTNTTETGASLEN